MTFSEFLPTKGTKAKSPSNQKKQQPTKNNSPRSGAPPASAVPAGAPAAGVARKGGTGDKGRGRGEIGDRDGEEERAGKRVMLSPSKQELRQAAMSMSDIMFALGLSLSLSLSHSVRENCLKSLRSLRR